jgi:tetratricopeptide (TPR) repeat protein
MSNASLQRVRRFFDSPREPMSANKAYQAALRALYTQRGDALALTREAARVEPALVAAQQLEAWLLLSSRDLRDFQAARRMSDRLAGTVMSAREALHAEALVAAATGDYAAAARLLDRITDQYPHDLVALVMAQVFDYYLGNAQGLLTRSLRALPHWSSSDPAYHALLSLHAFALEESGDYAAAESAARRALALEPLNVRAHHVVTHVLEMQGRAEEGLRWMGTRSAFWIGAGAASTHLWWHVALHQLELGRVRLALEVYDRRLQGNALSEMIDASALLWRLHLAGHDVGPRFGPLAVRWARYAEDAHCAFNDLHAMMSFAGARRWDYAQRLLQAQTRRATMPRAANHETIKRVGLPAGQALAAYGRGDYAEAEALLRALPPVAHLIGGSHAQRDVLQLTRTAAALRRTRKAA